MVHVPALPGTPRAALPMPEIIRHACKDALQFRDLGIDTLLVENMHDRPYLVGEAVGPEIVAAMTILAIEIKEATGLRCGIQILAAANRQSLACAVAAGLDFIRAEGFVFSHIADEGPIESDAATLLRFRRELRAGHIQILTDIKKKHGSHAVTADVDIVETARAAKFFLSDGLIVTGSRTAHAADLDEIRAVKAAVPDLPLVVGSGITAENAAEYLQHADGFIVGSFLKENGHWENPVSPRRVSALVEACRL